MASDAAQVSASQEATGGDGSESAGTNPASQRDAADYLFLPAGRDVSAPLPSRTRPCWILKLALNDNERGCPQHWGQPAGLDKSLGTNGLMSRPSWMSTRMFEESLRALTVALGPAVPRSCAVPPSPVGSRESGRSVCVERKPVVWPEHCERPIAFPAQTRWGSGGLSPAGSQRGSGRGGLVSPG